MLRLRTLTPYGLLLALLAGFSMASTAEQIALVIGNGQYAHSPYLNNPPRDAAAIAQALQNLGFTVTGPLRDQSKAQMDAAFKAFGQQAQSAEAAIVYFAGHGIEVGGDNYLIPVDAALPRDTVVSLEAVPLQTVLDQVGSARDYALVILDACRDNPFANQMQRQQGTRAIYRGLARVEPGGQIYVAYAAKAGSQAQEGTSEHSPFTTALLTYLRNYRREPLPLPSLFGAVREDVLATTSGEQEPWLYGAFGKKLIYLTDHDQSAAMPSQPALMPPDAINPAVAPHERSQPLRQTLTALHNPEAPFLLELWLEKDESASPTRTTAAVTRPTRFRTSDRVTLHYRVAMLPDEPSAYLTLVNVGPSGQLAVLYPDPRQWLKVPAEQRQQQALVKPGVVHRIPDRTRPTGHNVAVDLGLRLEAGQEFFMGIVTAEPLAWRPDTSAGDSRLADLRRQLAAQRFWATGMLTVEVE